MIDQLGSIQDSNNERFRMSSCISHVCRLEKREKKKENGHKTCIFPSFTFTTMNQSNNNYIFVFNAESPTDIAVQTETKEGIIQVTAGYYITINCSVNSGIPNETMIWRYNNTVVGVGGPAFISFTFIPARRDHLKNLTCSASNSNFSLAITKTIQLNVQCKFSYACIHMFNFSASYLFCSFKKMKILKISNGVIRSRK
jgi:hypothetical protein